MAQELSVHLQQPLNYWASRGTAEVDFLISTVLKKAETILPLEVKSGKNTKNKSITEYEKKYSPPLLIRTSQLNLKLDKKMLNIPLYSLGFMRNFFKLIQDEM